MARPTTTTEPQSKRSIQVTFGTVAEKQEWQEFAKEQGQSLAGLMKALLVVERRRIKKAA